MEQEQIFPLIRKDGSFSENVRISPAELKVKKYFDTLEKVLGNPQKEVADSLSEDYGRMTIGGLFSIERGKLTLPYEVHGVFEVYGFKNQFGVRSSSNITIFSPLEEGRQEWLAKIFIQSNNSQGDMCTKLEGKDEGLKVGYELMKDMLKKI